MQVVAIRYDMFNESCKEDQMADLVDSSDMRVGQYLIAREEQ